jgi:hypothetical protein
MRFLAVLEIYRKQTISDILLKFHQLTATLPYKSTDIRKIIPVTGRGGP